MSDNVTIRSELRPGDLGRIVTLHGEGYASEEGHFGLTFEAYVARTLADFVIDNEAQGRVWLAERGTALVGCAAMVARDDRGQLRWVIVSPSARSEGLGKRLVDEAMAYAAAQGWREVFLETTSGLPASMNIYVRLGFEIVGEEHLELWNPHVQKLIRMRKALK
jgi:N-acetylglutamate synthase-like GNAT family acetyltransferase